MRRVVLALGATLAALAGSAASLPVAAAAPVAARPVAAAPVAARPVAAAPVAAAASSPVLAASSPCELPHIGPQVPVLLVHGYNSRSQVWSDNPSMVKALDEPNLNAVDGIWTDTFDYAAVNDQWVTHERIGPALAHRIDCLHQASVLGGGNGKVVVVAHSMGGLATVCAVRADCNGGDPDIAGYVGLVVTVDTPYQGSFLRGTGSVSAAEQLLMHELRALCPTATSGQAAQLAPVLWAVWTVPCLVSSGVKGGSPAVDAFAADSPQLARLYGGNGSAWPDPIPVVAVAGRLGVASRIFGVTVQAAGDVGDLVVGKDSGRWGGHPVGGLGGTQLIDCGRLVLGAPDPVNEAVAYVEAVQGVKNVRCVHWGEPHNDVVENAVVPVVRRYVQTHPPYPERNDLGRFSSYVNGVAFSPRSTELAAVTNDGRLVLWDRLTRRRTFDALVDPGGINAVAYARGGADIVTAGIRGDLKVWEAGTGRARYGVDTGAALFTVRASPDGTRVAAAGIEGTVRIWSLADAGARLLLTTRQVPAYIGTVAWSPDGTLVAGSSSDGAFRIWDARSGALVQTVTGHSGKALSVAWSPDGQTIASGGVDHTVRLWSRPSGLTVGVLTGSTAATVFINQLAFSRDGRTLAAASGEGVVRLWDVTSQRLTARLSGPTGWVQTVAISADDRYVAGSGQDQHLWLWHVPDRSVA